MSIEVIGKGIISNIIKDMNQSITFVIKDVIDNNINKPNIDNYNNINIQTYICPATN